MGPGAKGRRTRHRIEESRPPKDDIQKGSMREEPSREDNVRAGLSQEEALQEDNIWKRGPEKGDTRERVSLWKGHQESRPRKEDTQRGRMRERDSWEGNTWE